MPGQPPNSCDCDRDFKIARADVELTKPGVLRPGSGAACAPPLGRLGKARVSTAELGFVRYLRSASDCRIAA